MPAPLFMPAVDGSVAVVIGEPQDARRYAELPRAQALEALFDRIAAVQQQAETIRRKT